VIDGDGTVASDPVVPGYAHPATTVSCAGASFTLQGNHFFQGNRFLLEKLGTWAQPWCRGESLVDLYGGAGFFSVMMADVVKRGWLIEVDRTMVDQAQTTFRQNGIGHIKPVAADAESLELFVPAKPACMIVDPPRPGLTRKVREAVVRIAPETIVYVSCNCATQARDCGFFCNRAGYAIESSALFDLYPNTHHSESIVVMRRKGS
jgi:23S rRNA (uracil1939-C5)-methyltransferase